MKTQKHNLFRIGIVAVLVAQLLNMGAIAYAQDSIPEGSKVAATDTTFPDDVENVKAIAGDASATLTWNVAKDNVGIKGYKIYYGTKSVVTDGADYEVGPVDVGNKITHTVKGLVNNSKYYFAVTAYDAAGNESENYSVEVSSTPSASAKSNDKEAPKVSKAEAVDKSHVKITFSEGVQLPTVNPQSAFSIKNDTTGAQLTVQDAVVDTADTTQKTVVLTTADQAKDAPYILTAGIDVKDLAANPIVSGTSDTAAFTGTDVEPLKQAATQQTPVGPQLLSVTALDNTHVEIVFSKPVVLKTNKVDSFLITEAPDFDVVLEITAVEANASGTRVTLTTQPQKAVNYNLIAVDVADTEKNVIDPANNATTFMGMAASANTQATQQPTQQPTQTQTQVVDKTPPEDVTNFTAAMLKKLVATLTWAKSLNSQNDLANYVLYMSTDGNTYGQPILIDPTASTFDVTDVVPGVKYFFKLAAKDVGGNESTGIITTFTLPETGPELGLLLVGSFGLAKFMKKRKK